MKQSVNIYDFRDAFRRCDRYGTFSYEGYQVLFDYLEQLEEDLGEEFELDVIAICCDWAQDTVKNVLREYSLESLEELEENTTVLYVSDSSDDEAYIIYQSF